MNSIWNKNFSLFAKRFPQLAGYIPTGRYISPEEIWSIGQAKNGEVTASENSSSATLRLHSTYNPTREAAGAVSVPEVSQKSTTVFYGFGLGYHLIEWCKKYPEKKLVVIEPDSKRLLAALQLLDWTAVFQHQSLVLALSCPAESVLGLLEDGSGVGLGNTGVSDAYYFDIPAFTAHAAGYFDTVRLLVKRNQRKNEINEATLKKFGKLWCRNSLKNVDWLGRLGEAGGICKATDRTCKADDRTGKAGGICKATDRTGKAGDRTCKATDRTGKAGGICKATDRTGKAGDRTGKAADRTCNFVSASGNSVTGIGQFRGRAAAGLPFLIVGAGPSLEKVLPHLEALKKRCVIVCVETSLRALLRNGVQPDFIILTDPQFWAYRHIAGLAAPDSILITEVSAYPAVFRFPCLQIALCSSQFPVGQWFEQKLGLTAASRNLVGAGDLPGKAGGQPAGSADSLLGDLGTGGSVASSAWNFAAFCGASEIYTVGLDFAFPGRQTHIRGSEAEQTYHTVSSRLATPDKFTATALFSANAVLSKDYNGRPVLTDSRMKMFSWWFEARLAGCPGVKTFTLSPEGLCTPGMQPAAVTDLLSKAECPALKEEFFATNHLFPQADIESRLKTLKKSFPNEEFLKAFPFLKEYF